MEHVRLNSDWPFINYELPRLDIIDKNLFSASFYLMKLLPARFILQKAENAGILYKGCNVIESTSGTFGLALAMLSAVRGYKLTLISDPAIDSRLLVRLEDLGAKVEIINKEHPDGGFQKARLQRLQEITKEYPIYFWPKQYENMDNPRAYGRLAEYLSEKIKRIDCLIGSVGSGGSMVGTATFLRKLNPNLSVIGVDTQYSVLFGQPNGNRQLRGLGNSILPKNLNHSLFDLVSWISAPVGFKATRYLHQNYGIYMGATSGAAYWVAKWYAKKHPNKNVVVLFPDEGHRYADTIYNNQWIKEQGLHIDSLPDEPKYVHNPLDGLNSWSIINWNRRTLSDVTNNITVNKY